jgi:hypothetical protein
VRATSPPCLAADAHLADDVLREPFCVVCLFSLPNRRRQHVHRLSLPVGPEATFGNEARPVGSHKPIWSRPLAIRFADSTRTNMIADFFSVLRLIFKHKQKNRLTAVFLFPSRRQCIKVGIRTPTGANLGDGETPAGVRAA